MSQPDPPATFPPAVVRLADRQLDAYNAADLEAFCACYAEDVVVLDPEGQVKTRGIDQFRRQYAAMFERFDKVCAAILGRVVCPPHLVEHEVGRRTSRDTGEEHSFELLVRYSERQGRIAVVQFLPSS